MSGEANVARAVAATPPASVRVGVGTPPGLPARSRGVIGLVEANCTVCMICARECPCWCIEIEGHTETEPAAYPGARPRSRNVLDRFAIDYATCMYCGICVDACPFEALLWSPEFRYAADDRRGLIHERDRLAGWAGTSPPPQAAGPAGTDPGA